MAARDGSVVLIVVDEHHFRRTAVMGLLDGWAGRHGCRVVGISAADSTVAASYPSCEMCILSVGADLGEPIWDALVRMMHGLDPRRPVVVLSDTEVSERILAAFRAGASGYIPTSLRPDVVLAALTFILGGGTYVPLSVLGTRATGTEGRNQLIAPDADDPSDDGSRYHYDGASTHLKSESKEDDEASEREFQDLLTDRQCAVLRELGLGASNKEIARTLDLSEATVKVHVREVLRRLGVSNRTQAAIMASQPSRSEESHEEHGPVSDDGAPLHAGDGDHDGRPNGSLPRHIPG